MKINKKGMTLVEVVIGIIMLSVFVLAMSRVIHSSYQNRTFAAINSYLVNVSDLVGGYLSCYDGEGDPGAGILTWDGVGLVDAKSVTNSEITNGNVTLLTVYLEDTDGDNILDWYSDPGLENPIDLDNCAGCTGNSLSEKENSYFDSRSGGSIADYSYTIGGSGKTMSLNGATGLSNDIQYVMRVFREIRTETDPNLVTYRVKIEIRPEWDLDGDGTADGDTNPVASLASNDTSGSGFKGNISRIQTEISYNKKK